MIKHTDGFVSLREYKRIMLKEGVAFRDVERRVLKNGLSPLRFQRNQNSISQKEQYKLFKSHVKVVGCGGLGANIAELLARVGIGKLTLIDHDTYCEHNLNRQKFSTIKNIGEKKVNEIAKNLKLINPALKVRKKDKFLNKKNIDNLLKNGDIIIDALDDPKTKLLLASWCKKHNKPFVHGAIAGKSLQVTTSTKLSNFYKSDEKGAEQICGNLAFTATNCASLQTLLCIKILLHKDFSLKNMLFCDLEDLEFLNLPIF